MHRNNPCGTREMDSSAHSSCMTLVLQPKKTVAPAAWTRKMRNEQRHNFGETVRKRGRKQQQGTLMPGGVLACRHLHISNWIPLASCEWNREFPQGMFPDNDNATVWQVALPFFRGALVLELAKPGTYICSVDVTEAGRRGFNPTFCHTCLCCPS